MGEIARIDPSLARGATRMALRELAAAVPGRCRDLVVFAERNPIRARRNEKARRRWLAKLPRPAILRLVTNADASRAGWIEHETMLPGPGSAWSGVLIARVSLDLRTGTSPAEVAPICFIDQHVLMRLSERRGDLAVAAYPGDIAEKTLGWIEAANQAEAPLIALPYLDGIIHGRRIAGGTMLSTYIGQAQLSTRRRAELARLRAELPPLPRMPRLSPLPEDTIRRTAAAMARACAAPGSV